MRMRKSKNKRRATILLIVVSLLALLFVIITGFLTLSRNERQTLQEFRRGDLTDRILDGQRNKAIDAMLNQITDAKGHVLSGPGAQFDDRLGGKAGFIAADPITSETVNLNPPPGSVEQQMDWARPSGADGYGPNGREAVPVDYAGMKRYVYPQLSRLNPQAGDKPEAFPVWQLVLENELDLGQNARRLDANDIANAAREPAMDANGDGLPDSWLLYQIPSIEEANAMAGTPVQLSGYFSDDGIALNDLRPYSIPPANNAGNPLFDAIHNAYRRYRETGRFDVAMMIKSHGGMVTLNAPRFRDPDTGMFMAPWNRLETVRMFDSFRSSYDLGMPGLAAYTSADRNYIFDQIAGSSSAVELSLRRRGGLPPFGVGQGNQRRTHAVPGILSLLQGDPGAGGANWRGFPETFVPRYRVVLPRGQASRAENSDRFNLAAPFSPNFGNDRYAAVRSSQVSATDQFEDEILAGGAVSLTAPWRALAKRGSLTANNNSDEIARKQVAGDALPVSKQPGPANLREIPASERTGLNAQLKFSATDPMPAPATPNPAANAGFTSSTYEGELKFPLSELAKGVRFSNDGRYRWQRFDEVDDVKRGDALIERMARLYYDMLSGHKGWIDPLVTIPPPTEVVSLRDQAFHLAVNTAAFMMPRSLGPVMPGFIDVVTYKDGAQGKTYVGYGPQPYISEAVACIKWDDAADQASDLSIAIEIFNPCDPYFRNLPATLPPTGPSDWQGIGGQPYDVFALPAQQFAISLTDVPPDDVMRPFSGVPLGSPERKRINGRCFYTLVFNIEGAGGPNDSFNNLPHSLYSLIPSFPEAQVRLGNQLNVFLWKQGIGEGADGRESGLDWYLVDKLSVDVSELISPNNQMAWTEKYHYTSRARDSRPNLQFGGFDFVTRAAGTGNDTLGIPDTFKDTYARWNIVLPPLDDPDVDATESRGAPRVTLGNQRYYTPGTGSSVNPDNFPSEVPTIHAPTVPLVLMNAGAYPNNVNTPLYERLNNLPMFGNQRITTNPDPQQGDLRPRSFPTVGFMMFVPRYAHVIGPAPTNSRKTASELLLDEWDEDYTASHAPYGPGPTFLPQYTIDIGHMPIFDNTQKTVDEGYFGDYPTVTTANPASAGPIPWGMLVFDYFTTLDPAAPGVDPLRVPGRININSAPWTTLSLLPVIGPAIPNPGGNERLPIDAGKYMLPILRNWIDTPARVITEAAGQMEIELFDPSPSFWDPKVGMLAGLGSTTESDPVVTVPPLPPPGDTVLYNSRLIHTDPYARDRGREWGNVEWDRDQLNATRWRLGRWLAVSAAAYRDGIQYVAYNPALTTNRPEYMRFADAHLRNPATPSATDVSRFRPVQGAANVAVVDDATPNRRYRDKSLYGEIRGAARPAPAPPWPDGAVERPTQFGFVSLGELLNAKGFDSTRHTWLPPYPSTAAVPANTPLGKSLTTLASGDFVKAVSLMALIDSQVLTTRSNTFTAYTSVLDRKQAESSVRAEFIVDRSNVLPRLAYDYRRPLQNVPFPLPDRVKLVDALDSTYNFYGGSPGDPLDTPVRWTATPGMKPSIIAEKRIGYYNTRFDE